MLPLQARVDLRVMAMKGYSAFPQSSSITGATPSDCLVTYPGHSLEGGDYPSAEKLIGQYIELLDIIELFNTNVYYHRKIFKSAIYKMTAMQH